MKILTNKEFLIGLGVGIAGVLVVQHLRRKKDESQSSFAGGGYHRALRGRCTCMRGDLCSPKGSSYITNSGSCADGYQFSAGTASK